MLPKLEGCGELLSNDNGTLDNRYHPDPLEGFESGFGTDEAAHLGRERFTDGLCLRRSCAGQHWQASRREAIGIGRKQHPQCPLILPDDHRRGDQRRKAEAALNRTWLDILAAEKNDGVLDPYEDLEIATAVDAPEVAGCLPVSQPSLSPGASGIDVAAGDRVKGRLSSGSDSLVEGITVEKQPAHPGVPGDIPSLVSGDVGGARHSNATGELDRPVHHDPPRRMVGKQPHPIPPLQAAADQVVGERTAPKKQFSVGDCSKDRPGPTVRHRRVAAVRTRRGHKQLGEGVHRW